MCGECRHSDGPRSEPGPRPSFSGEAKRRPEKLLKEMLGTSPSMTHSRLLRDWHDAAIPAFN